MVTYISPFIPHLSEYTSPLRKLLQKDADFQWHPEHATAFSAIKQQICNANSLSYFNPSKPTVLQVDSSQEALGAALLQEGRPIAYASKSLTDTEKRYANIERELLACVFGAERFHTYVYGKPFSIESDHKPLEMICKKNLTAAPARLQRMLLRLQRYDYSITYKPGKEMTLPDSLSRLPKHTTDATIDLNMKVCFVQFSSNKLAELRGSTTNDDELRLLMKYIIDGFPEKQRNIPVDIRKYWPYRDELSVENGLIIKGEQLVIPMTLRAKYLETIHEGHQGITRCQARARTCVFWPGINRDIESLISQCHQCWIHQASQAKETLEPIISSIPNLPWHTLCMDLFTLNDRNYLIIADYFSKYPIIHTLGSSSSSKTIAQIMSNTISLFGVPNTIITDNGPQFIGQVFQDLIKSYGITHTTSSPHHPKSHGFIERMIRTTKALMRKTPEDSDRAMLAYRTTPLGPQIASPAELLFGRKIQTTLPAYNRISNDEKLLEYRAVQQARSEVSHNPNTRELSELSLNQPIFYQDVAKKTWTPGIVIGHGPEPRSYTILCDSGKTLRRNRVYYDLARSHLLSPFKCLIHWEI